MLPMLFRTSGEALSNVVSNPGYEVPIKPFNSASIGIPYPRRVTTPLRGLSNILFSQRGGSILKPFKSDHEQFQPVLNSASNEIS
jgi:hypothetical protein